MHMRFASPFNHRLALGLMLTAAAAGSAAARVTLPAGFSRFDAAIALSSPTSIAFAPDGRMFVAQQNGIVRVFLNGVEQAQFIDLSAEVGSDGYRGLLGLALDPNFAS